MRHARKGSGKDKGAVAWAMGEPGTTLGLTAIEGRGTSEKKLFNFCGKLFNFSKKLFNFCREDVHLFLSSRITQAWWGGSMGVNGLEYLVGNTLHALNGGVTHLLVDVVKENIGHTVVAADFLHG